MAAGIDRATHNQEMWDREGLAEIRWTQNTAPGGRPVKGPSGKRWRCPIAVASVEEQGVGE